MAQIHYSLIYIYIICEQNIEVPAPWHATPAELASIDEKLMEIKFWKRKHDTVH